VPLAPRAPLAPQEAPLASQRERGAPPYNSIHELLSFSHSAIAAITPVDQLVALKSAGQLLWASQAIDGDKEDLVAVLREMLASQVYIELR
jgi:hypothetical protein